MIKKECNKKIYKIFILIPQNKISLINSKREAISVIKAKIIKIGRLSWYGDNLWLIISNARYKKNLKMRSSKYVWKIVDGVER